MPRLGISVYPEHASLERNKEYISQAAKYGFKRIFSCLLSVDKPKEEIIADFREMIDHAHANGMEVILDVAPYVFDRLGISYDDLSFFEELHADGIRLDEGFNGMREAQMTYNPQNLKIEINASNPCKYLTNICSYHPKKENLITCHNFYPQKYTGLGYDLFMDMSKEIKDMGFPVAAFVTSQEPGAFGPWPVSEGLVTLEMHRDLPADVAARHLFATGVVDDVLISDCFPSEEVLEAMSKIDPAKLTMKAELEGELSDVERKILYDFDHTVRGDMSEYMARSSWPRVVYASESIPARNTRDLKRGDIVILNDGYDRYKGELHVVLKDMPNDGKKNVIGHVPENERMLLNYLVPFKAFKFIS